MAGRRSWRRVVAWIPALLGLAVLPACGGGAAGRQAMRPGEPAVVPHSAYRPAYSPGPPRRTLFLGGYAGYIYGPSRPLGYVPTSGGVQTWDEPVGPHVTPAPAGY